MPKSFQPISGFELPRFAGVPTFMRLPHVSLDDSDIDKVQIGLIGTPWDTGTTNRPGPRHGPRQLRDYSTMIRAQNSHTDIRPFELVNCADLGDVGPNPADINDTMDRMSKFFKKVKSLGILPLTGGGDHLCSLPILRGIASDNPVGMIHFDSHTDLFNSYFGGTMYTHGTPFRRAVEEGLLDPKRVIQIGIRGTAYDKEDHEFAKSVGVKIIMIEEFFERGIKDIMIEARDVGGPNSFQAIQVVRELEGVDIIGADLVEVSPPFDPNGGTAWLGVSIMFELLCVMAKNISDKNL